MGSDGGEAEAPEENVWAVGDGPSEDDVRSNSDSGEWTSIFGSIIVILSVGGCWWLAAQLSLTGLGKFDRFDSFVGVFLVLVKFSTVIITKMIPERCMVEST